MKRDGKVSRHPPIRKLEFSLEDQIKQIFARAKLTSAGGGGSGGGGLVHLPAREGFVYVENELGGADDADRDMQRIYKQFGEDSSSIEP